MINGAHAIVYSRDAEADRAFLRDVIGLPSVDVGHGWLIFGLPPSEVAIHPADDEGGEHELYFMCDDIERLVKALDEKGLTCSAVQDQGWGLLTHVTLPGGGKLGIYQPRHARPV
jgi:catechol 2,3-dioxygenase-like lactoylglutathione lyase family enzyme